MAMQVKKSLIKKNVDLVNSLPDEKFNGWYKVMFRAVYSMIGFREEKEYGDADKIREMLESFGITFSVLKHGVRDFYFFFPTYVGCGKIRGFIQFVNNVINQEDCVYT